LFFSLTLASVNSASCNRTRSSVPEASPARIMLEKMGLKMVGCCATAAARLLPSVTSCLICPTTRRSLGFSTWSATAPMLSTSGIPALVSVAS
jgi:hypothetical protein